MKVEKISTCKLQIRTLKYISKRIYGDCSRNKKTRKQKNVFK